ncbi:MAG: hypothetical protein CMJ83_04900 [Planctomycetes bacterium]|nr:hypothetical protein [Planctomycetota bacterium]
MSVDLSVVVVNYNSSAYVEDLLDSLFADAFTVGDRPGEVEVIVVDNASRAEDHARLASLRGPQVRLVRNTENVGYAIANNQGFHVASGRWHVVSNPDVVIRPGCLQALINAVETLPDAAIVGPLATMDHEGEMLMPPNELLDPFLDSLIASARHEPAIARVRARHRTRDAHRYWTASAPLPVPMLSGCFFLGRRDTFEAHGLFDPGYPLYYEDLDLFLRYHREGRRLWHVPAARILHYWSRSADTHMKAAMHRNRVGSRRYFRKFFGAAGLRSHLSNDARATARARDDACPFTLDRLPPAADPPALPMPETDGVYLEVSANPKFFFSVGVLPLEAGPYTLPQGFWDGLPDVSLWCRAVDPATYDTLQAWRVTKRAQPSDDG